MTEFGPDNAIAFVQDTLPSLITSEDLHDKEGAVVAAKYLCQDIPPAGEQSANNLLWATAYGLHLQNMKEDDGSSGIKPESIKERLGLFIADVLYKYTGLFGHSVSKTQRIALMSIADLKSVQNEDTTLEESINDFEAVFAGKGWFTKNVMKNAWLWSYYKQKLGQESMSHNEMIAVKAASLVYKRHTKSPFRLTENWFDRRHIEDRLRAGS